jgi:hypothetical protein
VRALLSLLLLVSVLLPAAAQDAKPQTIRLGAITLEIVQGKEGEQELRAGGRVLLSDYRIEPGPTLQTDKISVGVFDVWAGGNACGGWPVIVSVDAAGQVSVDRTFENECRGFSVAAEADAILFVQQAVPGEDGSAWRFVPGSGLRRLGVLEFRPQPNRGWSDLDQSLDHPSSLFDVEPVDAAARRLGKAVYAEIAIALQVAGEVEKLGERYRIGTGCQPHACNSVAGFIGIDRIGRAVFFARRDESRVRTWPALGTWPRELRSAFESWRQGR